MAANKFATVLVYAVLEWILILLLLLNSTFSYFIHRFAAYFGLKPPCIWCSRIGPEKNAHFSQDLLCEEHAREVSKMDILDLIPCLNFKPSWDIVHHIWKIRVVNDDKYGEESEFSAAHKNGNKTEQVVKEDKNDDILAFNDEVQLVSDTESFSFEPIVEEDCSISVLNFPENEHQNYISMPKVGDESSDNIASVLESAIDENFTIEQLKSALKSQQKALSASYAELEAERNAAAIAASHTMAMISKLQEEKAAMQMEALQYQRMMEEQSEYDQEALQILNDLMKKREKENHELEKKVSYYESKEKMTTRRKNAGVESNNELLNDIDSMITKESETECFEQMSILDESVMEFEEERTSILQELKELEERLLALADDNFTEDHEQKLYDRYVYGLLEKNGNSLELPERESLSSTPKNLLPLLDEEAESIQEELKEHSLVHPFDLDNSKLAIMEEFRHVYEKLQALEADKEFLKHSISSLKKGDKGLDLLQEILQHLRDLKSVECIN